MESDQQQQKGLFTFYRQQAVLEEELKQKKIASMSPQEQKIIQNQKKRSSTRQDSKLSHKKVEEELFSNSGPSKDNQLENGDLSLKPQGSRDKLMSILRKYQPKQLKKNENLKVILQIQDQPHSNRPQQLKCRLQRLLKDEDDQNFSIIQPQRKINKQLSKQIFARKRQEVKKANPFRQIAVIPTNFVSELQQEMHLQMPSKKVPSPPKGLSYSFQVRKNDKIQMSLQLKGKHDDRTLKQSSNEIPKLFLPKIDIRSNSQMLIKPKIRPEKSGKKPQYQQISSERKKGKPQSPIYLNIIRFREELAHPKQGNNKIYSLFIENKQSRHAEDTYLIDKQVRLADVVKKMKFS